MLTPNSSIQFQSRNRETFDSNSAVWSPPVFVPMFQSRNRETYDSNLGAGGVGVSL